MLRPGIDKHTRESQIGARSLQKSIAHDGVFVNVST